MAAVRGVRTSAAHLHIAGCPAGLTSVRDRAQVVLGPSAHVDGARSLSPRDVVISPVRPIRCPALGWPPTTRAETGATPIQHASGAGRAVCLVGFRFRNSGYRSNDRASRRSHQLRLRLTRHPPAAGLTEVRLRFSPGLRRRCQRRWPVGRRAGNVCRPGPLAHRAGDPSRRPPIRC